MTAIAPSWLIQVDVFGRSFEPIKSAIRRHGMGYAIVQARQFLNGVIPTIGGCPLSEADCVVFSGTYPLLRHIQLHRKWVPGGWCNAEEFDCRRYYPVFGRELLNHDGFIGSIDDTLNQAESLFLRFADRDRVFMRPCGLEKTFTGRCADRAQLVSALESARYSRCHVLIASPRPIDREWRLVVAGPEIVAASQYRKHGADALDRGCPTEVRDFAAHSLASIDWKPDPIFMLDVCESAGTLRILELNSFSCSGLYLCDADAIVSFVKRLAINEWERARAAEAKTSQLRDAGSNAVV
jgi:hypothetical protein